MVIRLSHLRRGSSSPVAGRETSAAGAVTATGIALTVLLAGCADGGTTQADPADEEAAGAEGSGDAIADEAAADGDGTADAQAAPVSVEPPLPTNMPEGIPVPDEHVVVRATSMTGADADAELGEHVAVNIAIGGTVEEQRVSYETALVVAYGEVEHEDGMAGQAMRFRGEWFENGRVFLAENEGQLDRADLDTSHLPVLLTVQVWEHESD